jgi:RNA methyltransferase, TrmH family
VLTNPRSDRVKAVRSLSRRSVRSRTGQFLAEGPQAVREAVRHAAADVRDVYVTAQAQQRHPQIVAAAHAAQLWVHEVTPEVLAAMCDTEAPQGIVAVCRWSGPGLDEALAALPPDAFVCVLTHVRDPGNAGTVIRCADAAGAGGVVLTGASVDPYNGKAVRASAGSLFHLPLALDPGTAEVLDAVHRAGLLVLAADGRGELDLDDAEDAGLLGAPTAWLFGNEAWGLPADVAALADHRVRIPLHGRAESLNLATAAAVCLYASARAHRRG